MQRATPDELRHPALDPRAPPALPLLRSTCAVVLAGGRGKRLKQLTEHRAKPAMPFGGQFRMIDFPLGNCLNSGIRRIAVLTQYKAQSLIRHVTRGYRDFDGGMGEFIDVVPAQQKTGDSWYSGTADAVYQNLDMLDACGARHVLVLAGDHVYKMDYGHMLSEHVSRGADVTVGCVEVPLDQAGAFGVMQVDADGRVLRFDEKPAHALPMPGRADVVLASMGIYVFDARGLARTLASDAADAHSSHDFGTDLLPRLVRTARVNAYRFSSSGYAADGRRPYWRDVGTLDAYWEAHMDLTRPSPELDLYDEHWPIRSVFQHLPPAKCVFGHNQRCGEAVASLLAGGCVVSGGSVRHSVLSARAQVGEGSVVEDTVLLPGAVVGRNTLIRRAIVDEGCVLPDGLKIGVYPDEDRARFEVTAGGVTLVTAEMLAQGAAAG